MYVPNHKTTTSQRKWLISSKSCELVYSWFTWIIALTCQLPIPVENKIVKIKSFFLFGFIIMHLSYNPDKAHVISFLPDRTAVQIDAESYLTQIFPWWVILFTCALWMGPLYTSRSKTEKGVAKDKVFIRLNQGPMFPGPVRYLLSHCFI